MKTQILVLIALVFTSCTTVLFDEAQPKGIDPLPTVPEELWGTYNIGGSEVVALYVTATGFITDWEVDSSMVSYEELADMVELTEKQNNQTIFETTLTSEDAGDSALVIKKERYNWTLSEECQLKEYKGWYFLSTPDFDGKYEYWTVIPFKYNNEAIYFYWFDESGEDMDTEFSSYSSTDLLLQKINTIAKGEKIGESTLLLYPSKKKLIKLMESGILITEEPIRRVE